MAALQRYCLAAGRALRPLRGLDWRFRSGDFEPTFAVTASGLACGVRCAFNVAKGGAETWEFTHFDGFLDVILHRLIYTMDGKYKGLGA